MSSCVAQIAFVAALGLVATSLSACHDTRRTIDGNGVDASTSTGTGPKSDDPNAYLDLGNTDAGVCMPGQTPGMCSSPLAGNVGCGTVEFCGTDGAGNGLDDNCDGKVDDICTCVIGSVQKCFLGPPGKRNVGHCTDGQQTCQGLEFGSWGDCKGSFSPSAETCDGVDNDCNGCSDDGLCCDSLLTCPASVPDAQPYSDVTYQGPSYYHGSAATWSWTVTGGPCDQLFASTTGSPPAQSFTIAGGTTATPKIHFTLSGDYQVTMTVTDANGQVSTCTFIQHVSGPGVRFELCWDTTGIFGSDIDLHVHRSGTTTSFFGPTSQHEADDCNFSNCSASGASTGSTTPSWGYPTSPLAACSGGPEGLVWIGTGSCRNPRLDIDNVASLGVPENINIDNPKNGDTFRSMVHYYGVSGFTPTLVTHPLVNIYCGGHLKTTYGQAPNLVPDFKTPGAWAKGDMWRVADVTAIVDANGVTTDCTVNALHPSGSTTGYFVSHDNKTTYDGN